MLNIMVMYTLVKYEYIVNAHELCLKKSLGYSLAERNYKIFSVSLVVSGLIILMSVFLLNLIAFESTNYIVVGGLLTVATEIIFALIFIVKIGNANIQKYLKGGL